MLLVERLIAATAVFVAAHFAMGFINASAGGSKRLAALPVRERTPRAAGSSEASKGCSGC